MRYRVWFKIIAMTVAFLFLVNTIAWAYPPGTPGKDTLSTELVFQQQMMTQRAQWFKQSIFNDMKLLSSIFVMGKHLLENPDAADKPVPVEYFKSVIKNRYRTVEGHLAEIDLENVMPIDYLIKHKKEELDKALNEMGIKDYPHEGVVLIPFKKGGKKHIIQIALKSQISSENLPGYPVVVSDKYVVKDLNDDYMKEFAASAKKKEEPVISAPIAEVVDDEIEIPQDDIAETSKDVETPKKTSKFTISAILSAISIIILPLLAHVLAHADGGATVTSSILQTAALGSWWIIAAGIVGIVGYIAYKAYNKSQSALEESEPSLIAKALRLLLITGMLLPSIPAAALSKVILADDSAVKMPIAKVEGRLRDSFRNYTVKFSPGKHVVVMGTVAPVPSASFSYLVNLEDNSITSTNNYYYPPESTTSVPGGGSYRTMRKGVIEKLEDAIKLAKKKGAESSGDVVLFEEALESVKSLLTVEQIKPELPATPGDAQAIVIERRYDAYNKVKLTANEEEYIITTQTSGRYTFNRRDGTITYKDLTGLYAPKVYKPGKTGYTSTRNFLKDVLDYALQRGKPSRPKILKTATKIRTGFVEESARFAKEAAAETQDEIKKKTAPPQSKGIQTHQRRQDKSSIRQRRGQEKKQA
ncbi:hypothetical protein ACFL5Y_03325 [Candidatus Omnitrophota bacterium]